MSLSLFPSSATVTGTAARTVAKFAHVHFVVLVSDVTRAREGWHCSAWSSFLFIYIIMVDVCTVLVLYSTAVLNLATDLAQL